jgi:hypothetical protein
LCRSSPRADVTTLVWGRRRPIQQTNSGPHEHFQKCGGNVLRSFLPTPLRALYQSLPVYRAELAQSHLSSSFPTVALPLTPSPARATLRSNGW